VTVLTTTIWLAMAGLAHRRGRTAICIVVVAVSVAVHIQT